MDDVLQLVNGGSKDKTDSGDRLLSLLPHAIADDVDDSSLNELVAGLHIWLKSSNMKVS